MSDPVPSTDKQRTIVTDVQIPFGRLIVIFVKFGLAAIPAAIIVSIILTLIGFLLSLVFGEGFVTFMGRGMSV